MFVNNQVTDGAIIVGLDPLKKGTVLEKVGDNYKKLEIVANADAILLQDVTPTTVGVVSVIAVGGVVEFIKEDELYLATGITAKDIKPVLRKVGLYIKGVK